MRNDRMFMLFNLSPSMRSWRGLRLLIVAYFGSLLFAAIVSPWVYWTMQWLHGILPNVFHYLAYKSFDDYFDRIRWIPLVISLPFLFIKCHIFTPQQLGLQFSADQFTRFLKWFAIGVGCLLAIAAIQVHFAGASFKTDLSTGRIFGILIAALLGGLILGLLEEVVFRGLVLRMFYTAFGPVFAVLLSSLFFSYAHFKMPDEIWDKTTAAQVNSHDLLQYEIKYGYAPPEDASRVKKWSGFFVAWWTVFGISENFNPIKFLNLFTLGAVLCLATLRTRSLIPCIGLHAGIVVTMLSYRKIAHFGEYTIFFGGNGIVDGLLAFVLLLLLGLFILTLPVPPPPAFKTKPAKM